MATIRAVLRERPRADGACPIYIRISHKGKETFVSLGVCVRPTQWNPIAHRLRKSHRHHHLLNPHIAEVCAEIEELALTWRLERRRFTAYDLKDAYLASQGANAAAAAPDFLDWCDARKEEYHRYNTRRNVGTAIGRLRGYLESRGETTLPLTVLTRSFVRSFVAYLQSEGLAASSIDKYLRSLRALWMMASEAGYAEGLSNPFATDLIPSPEAAIIPTLSEEEYTRFRALTPQPGLLAFHAHRAFCFAVRAQGMRFSDVCTLRWESLTSEVFTYRMSKTGRVIKVQNTQALDELLMPYREAQAQAKAPATACVFPFLQGYEHASADDQKRRISGRTALVNRNLKALAEQAKISVKVTSHVARHTFARLYYEATRDVVMVQNALGHSSVRETMGYLSSLRGVVLSGGEGGELF